MSLGTPAVSAPAVTKSTATALIVGNSASELAEQLQRVGYCDVLCVDASEEATTNMTEKHTSDKGLRFQTM
eukprot:4913775-Pyramimonas_sp.AAC.1